MIANMAPVKAQTVPAASYIDTVTSHVTLIIFPIASAKDLIQTVTAYIASATSHMYSFEPAATSLQKMTKPFFYYKGCLLPWIHIEY